MNIRFGKAPSIKKRKFYGQKKLTFWLNPKVYAVAGNYIDTGYCSIATAIKQQLSGFEQVSVYPGSVLIDGIRYRIMGESGICEHITHSKQHNLVVPVILSRI